MQGKSPVVGMIVCAALVLVLSFASWGSFMGRMNAPRMSGGPFGSHPMFHDNGMRINATLNGWNGTVTVAGIQIPNYMVVLAAVAIGVIALIQLNKPKTVPAFVPAVLAGCGALFMLIFLVIIGSNGQIALGSILTFLAFVGMLVFSIADARKPVPSTDGEQSEQA